ncbi:conserved Plasmodium membrane protein, unknown function [Babesia microti strain RI]|uniref:Uncharacterized protein n=1 Tax=Babesia microti (strain RI) TaxID=1133968 RepID=A0A1R4AAB7_BABMR|nr:conserved Plasmodium membrane protein, unknown function [Babesia microti strain RI]SJK85938.1 conserved Plasmodium membrane protein, unknown function [Babesia microti strain RI]|eukprot:XP_021338145.1 conserved Plasmodium membrane protein, unknown function [Babesia microti strain RI]
MILSKKSERLPYNKDAKLNSGNIIDPVRYIFRVILTSADALFLVYLAWASQQVSNLNISYLRKANTFKSLSLIWAMKFFWALFYDKLSFTFTGNYYRFKYAISLVNYYMHSLLNSIAVFVKKGKFKLQFDLSEYPIDTHVYKSDRKSQMVILSHLLTLIGLQIITITHWIMPFELLKLNENLQYIKFFGILLVGFSIVGQSSASDVRVYCDVRELSTDKQTLVVCEVLAYKALFGLMAQFLLFRNKLHLFKYFIVSKCLIVILILISREDINKSLQTRYISNKRVDNFEILVPCLWFFIILHCGIDSRWYFQLFGMRDFPWSRIFDVLTAFSNQLAKIAILIAIGMYINFNSFPKLFPFSIAICLVLKLIGLVLLKVNIDPAYTLSLVLLEVICSSFVQQAVLVCILMICINAPTKIPIAFMSLPTVVMHYSTILRYSSSIWDSILSAQSSLVTIQTISISIYLVALVTCWNIKFDEITSKVRDLHTSYLKKLNKQRTRDCYKDGVGDENFWVCDD